MLYSRNGVSVLCFLLYFIPSLAQSPDSLVNEYLSRYRSGHYDLSMQKSILALDPGRVLPVLHLRCHDSLSVIRRATYSLIKETGLTAHNPLITKHCILALVSGCLDKDPFVANENINNLTAFSSSVFDPEIRYELAEVYRKSSHPSGDLVLLCGFAGTRDLIPDFTRAVSETAKTSRQSQWAFHLALARMGEKNEVDYCLRQVRKYPLSDDVVSELFPDLIYIRQKETFNYCFGCIADSALHCTSSNPDREMQVPCACRIIRMVAPYVRNFPADADKKKPCDNTAISSVREWWYANKGTVILNDGLY